MINSDFALECGIMSGRIAQKDANESAEKSWDSPHFSSKNCGQSRFFRRYKKIVLFFAFLCLLIFTGNSAFTEIYKAGVEDISNRKYFKATLDTIEKAEISILAAIYLVSLNPNNIDDPVKILLDALIAAKKRGVDVKMILEYHSEKDFTPEGLNYYAYHYLKDNGIDIHFDKSSHRCLHAKAIVIDEETVITGSSN